MTQKGQVVIPEPIRRHFNLKQSSRVYFEIRDNEIIAKPTPTLDEIIGIVKWKKKFTKKEIKKAISDAVVEKFERKMSNDLP